MNEEETMEMREKYLKKLGKSVPGVIRVGNKFLIESELEDFKYRLKILISQKQTKAELALVCLQMADSITSRENLKDTQSPKRINFLCWLKGHDFIHKYETLCNHCDNYTKKCSRCNISICKCKLLFSKVKSLRQRMINE